MTSRQSRTGLFLALFALVAQLGWNTRVPDLAAIELAALLGQPGVICHVGGGDVGGGGGDVGGDGGGGGGGQHAPGNPADDCMSCPCCLGTVLPAALPVPPPPLPLPLGIAEAAPIPTPPSTGPPPQARFGPALPRGPPAQA